jgi:DNA-binding CsgD family transcriptional regulator
MDHDSNNPSLRAVALGALEQVEERISLASLWQELTEGKALAVEHFSQDHRCFVVVRKTGDLPRASLPSARNIGILKRILLGEPQKVIALDYGLSQSTVALVAAQCAQAMGFACSATRIPALMMMAAYAVERRPEQLVGSSASFAYGSTTYRVISVERPGAASIGVLSAAERAVVELLVERRTNAEIARIRSTSTRTVANQLTSVLQKLGVRGRSAILSRLIELSAASQDPHLPLAV